MNGRSKRWRLAGSLFAAFALVALLLPALLRAEDSSQPARAVRLSSVQGHVQVAQGGQMLADPALANMPLFEGTQVTTLDDGQAEIQFEDGSIARLSPNSSLTLSVLRGQGASAETEITAVAGLGYFELQAGEGAPARLRFADAVVTVNGFTVLRVNLDNPPGELAVFTGNAHVERGDAMMLDMREGESVALSSVAPSRYTLSETIEPDSWDAWNADRDQALQNEYASQTGATRGVPDASNPAWADLDANGAWYNVPGQGNIWSPNEASSPDWDPYGDGYWVYGGNYGYMWVSGAAWGYLPYQCGLWNYYDSFGWGWMPGMCHPWWLQGGWFSNIGFAPGGYRFPRQPHPIPGRPHHPVPLAAGNSVRAAAHPVIPVNRKLTGVTGTLPARSREVPVVIAGRAVMPLRPGAARPTYDHASPVYANRSMPPAASRTGVNFGNNNYPGNTHPTGGVRPGPAPGNHPTGGGSTRASAPGGGGGGAAHGGSAPSSGGGGGSHGGGGGGGGGSHR